MTQVASNVLKPGHPCSSSESTGASDRWFVTGIAKKLNVNCSLIRYLASWTSLCELCWGAPFGNGGGEPWKKQPITIKIKVSCRLRLYLTAINSKTGWWFGAFDFFHNIWECHHPN